MSENKSAYEDIARVGEWARWILVGGLAAVTTFVVTRALESPLAIAAIGLAAAVLSSVFLRASSRDLELEDRGIRWRIVELLAVAGALAAVVCLLQLIRYLF